ncbi:MAG TPA: hypothetical protein VJN64_06780 [Terriglobales bacterium]|nr:hypothetical protein [Terriglobales bacterium]
MNCNICAYILIAALAYGPLAWAQDIHIRIVNARNGKPITDECLNISLGKWHGAELLAQTNSDGAVVLHLKGGQVTVVTNSPKACNTEAIVGPKPFTDDKRSISVMGDIYVVCQEYGNNVSGQPPPFNGDLIPTYAVTKILESGMTAANTCGKVRAQAGKGELLLFARPMSFWERMKL